MNTRHIQSFQSRQKVKKCSNGLQEDLNRFNGVSFFFIRGHVNPARQKEKHQRGHIAVSRFVGNL